MKNSSFCTALPPPIFLGWRNYREETSIETRVSAEVETLLQDTQKLRVIKRQ